MSSKVISNDKENNQMLFSIKKNLVKSENNKPKSNALKPVQNDQLSDPKRRRALGDVFNTTTALNNNNQLKSNSLKDEAKLGKTKLIQKSNPVKTNKCVESTSEDAHDQVEKCNVYVDTFDDLFEHGKISDLFVKTKVNMMPRLPCGNIASRLQDEFVQFSVANDDSVWKKQLQSVNKMLRKERTYKQEELVIDPDVCELPELEMPSFLNDF